MPTATRLIELQQEYWQSASPHNIPNESNYLNVFRTARLRAASDFFLERIEGFS